MIIPGNVTIPSCSPEYEPVYSTEIAQCYPGKNKEGKGIRKPTVHEKRNCIGKGFLIEEIIMIKPRLLLLMGKISRDSFFDYVLKVRYPRRLTDHISDISLAGKMPMFSVSNLNLHVLPIQHASGTNPRFPSMMTDNALVELIREVLE